MSSKSSRPADPAAKSRERAAQNLKRNGRPHKPRPAARDIKVESYDCDTVPQFCAKNRLSVSFFYKMRRLGKMPRELHVGNRTLITREASEEWRRAREAETAAKTWK